MVCLGCKDNCLQHGQSLRRQAFMYFSDQLSVLEVAFKVTFDNGFHGFYGSSGSMKCFDYGDVGQ